MQLIPVETLNSNVPCPDCGERMLKNDRPLAPWPNPEKPEQEMRKYLGSAFCDQCLETHPWTVRA